MCYFFQCCRNCCSCDTLTACTSLKQAILILSKPEIIGFFFCFFCFTNIARLHGDQTSHGANLPPLTPPLPQTTPWAPSAVMCIRDDWCNLQRLMGARGVYVPCTWSCPTWSGRQMWRRLPISVETNMCHCANLAPTGASGPRPQPLPPLPPPHSWSVNVKRLRLRKPIRESINTDRGERGKSVYGSQ